MVRVGRAVGRPERFLAMEQKTESARGVGPEAPLLVRRGTSRQIYPFDSLSNWQDNLEALDSRPLLRALFDRGYPVDSLRSMLRCGLQTDFMVATCGCGSSVVPMTYSCDSRTCSNCAYRRKRRLKNRFLPFLKACKQDRLNLLYFLTIAPEHYSTLEEGLVEIKKAFNRLRHVKYVADRFKAGLCVVETKESKGDEWHVHLHVLVYGRSVDNRMRGKCLDCGQSYMKQDLFDKRFYCANKSCNSKNVQVNSKTRMVSIVESAFRRKAHVYVSQVRGAESTLNYLLKYVSSSKEDFSSVQKEADYLCAIRGKRLVNAFGLFFKDKNGKHISFIVGKNKVVCPSCGEVVIFTYDIELSYSLLHIKDRPKLQEKIIGDAIEVLLKRSGVERSS